MQHISTADPILLSSPGHTIGCRFDPVNKKWFLLDTNDLNEKDPLYCKEITDEAQLVDALFTAFECTNFLNLTTTLLSTSLDVELLTACKRLDADFPIPLNAYGDNEPMQLIHMASLNGNLPLVQSALKNAPNTIDSPNGNNSTPLYLACANGNLEVVIELLKHNANIEGSPHSTFTPLHIASGQGHLAIVKELLKFPEINLEANSNSLFSPLDNALAQGHLDIAKYLLEKGANLTENSLYSACENGYTDNVELILLGKKKTHYEKCHFTYLHIACLRGFLPIVKLLIIHGGADIHQVDANGSTAFHYACASGNTELIDYLLKNSAQEDYKNKKGKTPFICICESGNLTAIKLLINHLKLTPGFNINDMDIFGNTPLIQAVSQADSIEVIQFLIDEGASIVQKTNEQLSALHVGCKFGKTRMVKIILEALIQAQGNLNFFYEEDNNQFNSLRYACDSENPELIQLLLDYGANPHQKDSQGMSLFNYVLKKERASLVKPILKHDINNGLSDNLTFQLACQFGFTEFVKTLVKQPNIDINLLDSQNRSPLDVACQFQQEDIVEFLLAQGADVNPCELSESALFLAYKNTNFKLVEMLLKHPNIKQEDRKGIPLLHHACRDGHLNLVRLLLEKQPDVYLQKKFSWHKKNPLHLACEEGHVEIVKLLINYDSELLNVKDSVDKTPLLIACSSSSEQHSLTAMFLLTQQDIDVNSKDCFGKTPLYDSCARNNFEIVQQLLEKKASHLVIESSLGSLPLHAACGFNNATLVQILLEAGRAEISLRQKTIFGQTPFDVAFKKGMDQTIKFLLMFALDNNYLPTNIISITDFNAVENWIKNNCVMHDEQNKLLSFLKKKETVSYALFKIKSEESEQTKGVTQSVTPT